MDITGSDEDGFTITGTYSPVGDDEQQNYPPQTGLELNEYLYGMISNIFIMLSLAFTLIWLIIYRKMLTKD